MAVKLNIKHIVYYNLHDAHFYCRTAAVSSNTAYLQCD